MEPPQSTGDHPAEPPPSEARPEESGALEASAKGGVPGPEETLPVTPPKPRGAVIRAHRVPHAVANRSDYLRLDLGESHRPASPNILKAIQRLESEDLAHYPDPWPLQQALARLHGVGPECISITAGADEAIRLAFNAYVEEGARVLIPRPTLGAILAAASASGAFVDRVDFTEDLSFPLEAFEKLLAPRTPRMAVIANPDAPTGTAVARDDVLHLAEASPSTLFLVNETFVAYHGQSLLALERNRELPPNILVLRSFSKDHGLAGLRIGYLVGHPEVIEAINVVRPSYTVSSPSLLAALAALEETEAMQAHVLNVRAHMERLVAKLALRGIEARATRANFVLVRLTAPIQPWAAAFAAHQVLVGISGHVGPMAAYVRITVNNDDEANLFLDTLALLLRQGVGGADRVQGVPGNWDELGSEGMA